ncbi:kinase binding protein CGI-121-domain-containing protein [Dipodascopsis tothii]|uniref:kinase binding protein CGI-121-domain-containing protein n=1 Tax=Dipodascopsis tothii TaxID=44089 RepID=UPI0034CF2DC0
MDRTALARHPGTPVWTGLVRDVGNAAEIRAALLAGDAAYEYAFVDASTILSREHLLAAVNRALTDREHDAVRTKNIHSEIVFALSPNGNISEALRRFGVADTTKDLVVVRVGGPAPPVAGLVAGTLEPLTDAALAACVRPDAVRKNYKLKAADAELGPLVAGAIALRGYL